MHHPEPGVVIIDPDGTTRTVDIEQDHNPHDQLRVLAYELDHPAPRVLTAKRCRIAYHPVGAPNPVAATVLFLWAALPVQMTALFQGPVAITGTQHEDDTGPLRNHTAEQAARLLELADQARPHFF